MNLIGISGMSQTKDKADLDGQIRATKIMTSPVVTVGPDASIPEIANLLLDKHISAVPVVGSGGIPLGIVSEGDLIGRTEPNRLARIDWWLRLIGGRLPLDEVFIKRLKGEGRTARDVMSAPLVTVSENTDISEIARLFAIHHIKRVPVVRDGQLVGIVSRANLLRMVAAGHPNEKKPETERKRGGLLTSLFGEYHLPAWETVAGIKASMPSPTTHELPLAAADFRELVKDFHSGEVIHRDEAHRQASARRRERAKQLIDEHVFDDGWRELIHRARVAAENGERECMLLQFPSQLCIDGGRAINVHEKGWSASLRGRPAEIFLRWERELKSRGFLLSARIITYPEGKPGDIGLFLVWADE
ncbi:MAG TPA: CBS domain-containing protein [Acetobacteraceae bacterium]|nr:CBS domain-containing protein [Acetobacteraceae bacterium]